MLQEATVELDSRSTCRMTGHEVRVVSDYYAPCAQFEEPRQKAYRKAINIAESAYQRNFLFSWSKATTHLRLILPGRFPGKEHHAKQTSRISHVKRG